MQLLLYKKQFWVKYYFVLFLPKFDILAITFEPKMQESQ